MVKEHGYTAVPGLYSTATADMGSTPYGLLLYKSPQGEARAAATMKYSFNILQLAVPTALRLRCLTLAVSSLLSQLRRLAHPTGVVYFFWPHCMLRATA